MDFELVIGAGTLGSFGARTAIDLGAQTAIVAALTCQKDVSTLSCCAA